MIEIRRLEGQEFFDVSRRLAGYAFHPSPPLPTQEEWEKSVKYMTGSVYLALTVDGEIASIAAYDTMTQYLRGQLWKAAGVWGVATWPTFRRNGHARQLLLKLLSHMNESGMALSTLYPFRESFYDRLGYVSFPRAKKARFAVQPLLPLLKKDLPGRVELYPMAQGLEAYRNYLEENQTDYPGFALFERRNYEGMRESDRLWVALARAHDNTPVGVMLYKIKDHNDDMQVSRFYSKNSLGRYLLLEWFARHADQAGQIEVRLPPAELPETWWPDLNPDVSSYEPPMGRILNLARLNGLATGPGRFEALITDPQCEWNNGAFRFETVEGQLKITSLGPSAPALHLSIQALTALAYGTHDPADFALRGWANPTPAQEDIMRQMFPPQLPYLHEIF